MKKGEERRCMVKDEPGRKELKEEKRKGIGKKRDSCKELIKKNYPVHHRGLGQAGGGGDPNVPEIS